MRRPHPVWDPAIRLFHWSLPILVALAWWSGEEGDFDLHAWVGYSVLCLVLFRLGWGFVGSPHARFSDFLRGPGAIRAYWREGRSGPGHSPPGGWSVVALLALLFLQAFSGLFNSDDILFDGPWHYAAPTAFRDAMGSLHEIGFDLLLVMVALHVAAVLYYQLRRREKLLQAMWRGHAEGKEGRGAAAPLWRAALLLCVAAALVWLVVTAAPQPVSSW
jgi:cytochrome b